MLTKQQCEKLEIKIIKEKQKCKFNKNILAAKLGITPQALSQTLTRKVTQANIEKKLIAWMEEK